MKITDLRAELGLTQDEFAARIGLSSKGNVSIIERENRCGLKVALAIEALSGGRIDAATLNEEVRLSRVAVLNIVDTAPAAPTSPGKSGDFAAPKREAA